MIPTHLLLHLLLLPLLSTATLCRPPNLYTSAFHTQHPIGSPSLALSNLRPTRIIPLLFANTISNFIHVSPRSFHLIRARTHRVRVIITHNSPTKTVLYIRDHHQDAFPVSLRHAKFTVFVVNRTLHIAFRARFVRDPAVRRARNIYARALVKTMLENSRLVLGLAACSSSFSSITAVCNNPYHPMFGITNALQIRKTTRDALHISKRLPNPRHVSNQLCRNTTATVALKRTNLLMVIFGQFIDHDLILTPSTETSLRDQSFNLPKYDVANGTMRFFRSDPQPIAPGKCCNAPYKPSSGENRQYNRVTSFLDASTVYGSDHDRAMALRSFKNGKLILQAHKRQYTLPRNTKQFLPYLLDNANQRHDPNLYASGDIRANENPVLLALHTMFAREHNRICNLLRYQLKKSNHKKHQSDEWFYQQARRVVIAEIQNIAYNEFLPALLGPGTLSKYRGYQPHVDASMDIMFTTAAYRWGHSAIPDFLTVKSIQHSPTQHRYRLQDAFFNPKVYDRHNVEQWLLGAMDSPASAVDLQHVDSVRDFLFSPNRRGVLDLAAINIQRGRDHGLSSYLTARKSYGLSNRGLSSIDAATRLKLLDVYGSSNNIDPFIGGLAEKTKKGSLLGPFFHRVVKDQFERLRDGDRFYYENIKWGPFLSSLRVVKKIKRGKWTLFDVISRNSGIEKRHLRPRKSAMKTR